MNLVIFVILPVARKVMIVVGITVLKMRMSSMFVFMCSMGRRDRSDEQREPRDDEEPEDGDA